MARYTVGPNQTYKTIQEGIEAAANTIGSATFTENQEILIVEDGVYGGFNINPGYFTPTSSNRLYIKAAAGIRPTITKSPAFGTTGANVGTATPYVTLDGLHFRDLDRGIVVGANSHNLIVNRCRMDLCRENAIWIYQADQAFIANTIIAGSKIGIFAQKVRDIAIVQNTLYNDLDFTDEATYLAYLELEADNGQGTADTGKIYFFKNILFSQSSHGLAINRKDLNQSRAQDDPCLFSDFNCWYFPSAGAESGLVEIREELPSGLTQSRMTKLKPSIVADPQAWATVSGQDGSSVADNPDWQSSGFAIAHSFSSGLCVDPYDRMPTWADKALLCYDYDGVSRHYYPIPGARNQNTSSEDYTTKVYTGVLDPTDLPASTTEEILPDCDPDPSSPILTKYESSVPTWQPKVHRGIFYSRDEEYYLYANKQSALLTDTIRYTWQLSSVLMSEDLQVIAAGDDVTDTGKYDLEGYTFTIYRHHLDPTADVVVKGYIYDWDPTTHKFIQDSPGKFVEHRLRVKDALVQYVLPSKPVGNGPVVVTDDTIFPTDTAGLAPEFKLEYDPELDEAQLVMGKTENLWANPDFHYIETGSVVSGSGWAEEGDYPKYYEFNDTSFIGSVPYTKRTGANLELVPLRGGKALYMASGETGTWIGQRIHIDPDQPYVLSAYGSSFSTTEAGTLQVSVSFHDWSNAELATAGPYDMVNSPVSDVAPEWKRFGIHLYNTPDSTYGRPDLSTYVDDVIGDPISIPADTDSVFVRFVRGDGGPVLLDCIQLEEGYEATEFTSIPHPDDVTIEWEGGEGRFHTLSDLNLHPMRNAVPSGFLAIAPVSARQFDRDARAGTNILTDYRWSWGRRNLLPWAKLTGFNKYRRRVWFSDTHTPMEDTVSMSQHVAQPTTIKVTPDTIVATADTDGSLFNVQVFDDEDNVYAFERTRVSIYDQTGEFPGYLTRSEWGVSVEYGQRITTDLDEGGTRSFRFIPPASEDIAYYGSKPATQSSSDVLGGTPYGYIHTKYRVLPDNHGGAYVTDQIGSVPDTVGDEIDSVYIGSYGPDGITRVQLPSHPSPGTITVWGTETGATHDTVFPEMLDPPLMDKHAGIDYVRAEIQVNGHWPAGFRVKYRPQLVWYNVDHPRRLYIAKQVLDQLSGSIEVHYDAELKLATEALSPRGHEQGTSKYLGSRVIVQHGER